MLPPLLSDIKSHHTVFDMCAAPGSKTAQILELIMSDHLKTQGKSNSVAPKGLVVANDADHKRAYLLTHQLHRLNTANTVVINHYAQVYPNLFNKKIKGSDQRFQFDRVLCDVPCSSDAAIRKMPQKWAVWNPKNSHSLHSLQLKILERGLEVLKVGGKLSYSTCSLNPIENEAVVAAALKRYPGLIRLVKVQLPGFRFQEGLKTWKVMTMKPKSEEIGEKAFNNYDSWGQVPVDVRGKGPDMLCESMFEETYSKSIIDVLPLCLRVMPHQ